MTTGSSFSPDRKSLAYQSMELQWQLIDDLTSGTDGMRVAGQRRLPRRMREPMNFYKARLNSTFLYEALKDTVDAIVAKPFSQSVVVKGKLSPSLAALVENVDGRGTSLSEFAAQTFRTGWLYGASHILIDFPHRPSVEQEILAAGSGEAVPTVTPDNNLAQDIESGARPVFVHVGPKSLYGWQHRVVGGAQKLSLIRVYEEDTVGVSDFEEEVVRRVRVIREGSWTVYQETYVGANQVSWTQTDGVMSIGEVPLASFFTQKDGTIECEPPLKGLAYLNEAHWQSSSLQRNSLDVARIPILVKLGFNTAGDAANSGPETTVVSSNVAFESPDVNAKVFYCEHSGAALQAGERDLDRLEKQMALLGNQPWAVGSDPSTATGVVSSTAKGESIVQRSVRNLERALEQAFGFAALWLGEELPEDFEINVYDEFEVAPQRATDISSLKDIWVARGITHKTFLNEVKRRSLLGKDLDVDLEAELVMSEGEDLASMTQSTGVEGEEEETSAEEEEDEEENGGTEGPSGPLF